MICPICEGIKGGCLSCDWTGQVFELQHLTSRYVCYTCKIMYGHHIVYCPGCGNQMVKHKFNYKELREFDNKLLPEYDTEFDIDKRKEYYYLDEKQPSLEHAQKLAKERFLNRWSLPDDCVVQFRYDAESRTYTPYYDGSGVSIYAKPAAKRHCVEYRLKPKP